MKSVFISLVIGLRFLLLLSATLIVSFQCSLFASLIETRDVQMSISDEENARL